MWAKFPAQLLHRQSYLLLLLHSGAGTYGEQHPRLWPTTKSHKLAVAAQWCQGGRSLLVFSCCQHCSNHAWAACSLVPQQAFSVLHVVCSRGSKHRGPGNLQVAALS